MKNNELQTKQNNFWTDSDQAEIIKMLAVVINNQKAFGKTYSIKDTFQFYKFKLDGKFSKDQVLAAVDAYTDFKNDVPQPADIRAIIEPEQKKITYAEYKHALEQHALEGFPMFGYYGTMIKNYEKQTNEDNGTKSYAEILANRTQAKIAAPLKQELLEIGAIKDFDGNGR